MCHGATSDSGVIWRSVDMRAAAGAIGDGELGPRAVIRKAGNAGPGEWELPRAEPKRRAWRRAAAGTSESSEALAGS